MKKENKKQYHKGVRCQLGFHKWQRAGADFVLEGVKGKIEAKTCILCGHKSPDGKFIPDKKNTTYDYTSLPDNYVSSSSTVMTGMDGQAGSVGGAGGRVIINGKDITGKKIPKNEMDELAREFDEAMKEMNKTMKEMDEIFSRPVSDYCECLKLQDESSGSICNLCKKKIK